MTLHITTDRPLVRAGVHSTRYVRIRFTAPEAPRHGERLPLDVALVIDKSGSMGGGKLELAKMAARRAVELLGPRDHVALVAYDTDVELLAAGALLDPSHQRRLLSAIDHLHPGSSTNLSGGWLMGCEEVGRAGREGTIARTLLLSDGLANAGITDVERAQDPRRRTPRPRRGHQHLRHRRRLRRTAHGRDGPRRRRQLLLPPAARNRFPNS